MSWSWWSLVHFRPQRIEGRLDALLRAGVIRCRPNLWQLLLGIAYMVHRLVFRPQTVGVDTAGTVRSTRRAHLLRWRALRLPLLFYKRAVNPLDHTGLGSSDAHLIRHLVGAFHAGDNFHYDLQLLAVTPGMLGTLHRRVVSILDGSSSDAEFLQDLVVYEGYHECLLHAVERWIDSPPVMSHDNPDTTLAAFLTWCAGQPPTPTATLRALRTGDLSFAPTMPA